MNIDYYRHDDPWVLQEAVKQDFDKRLPPTGGAYIRQFSERDCAQKYFKSGWYGLFRADGSIWVRADSREDLEWTVSRMGGTLYQVH
jgi:hypothetical protein